MNNALNNGTTASAALIEGPELIAARDHSIVDAAYRALRASGYGQLRGLSVHCDNGRVTLQGRVPTFYLKQVAQSVLKPIHGITDIDNDLSVQIPR